MTPADINHIRQRFEIAKEIVTNALVGFERILKASQKAVISKEDQAKLKKYITSTKQLISDINRQESAWMTALTRGRTAAVLNWPLTPLTEQGKINGMRFKAAHSHAAPSVIEFMNEAAYNGERIKNQIKRQKQFKSKMVTAGAYGFDQSKNMSNLRHRYFGLKKKAHPIMQPFIAASYFNAQKYLL
jgi:hypothetical protein